MKNRIPTLRLLALLAACAVTWSAQAQAFRHITIDGDMSDWAGMTPLYTDLQDSPTSLDYKDIYVANDANYLYLRFTAYPATDPTYLNPLLGYNNLFIDTDTTFGTGKPVGGQLGSELFIQNGNGYQQDNTAPWYVGNVDGMNWSMAPTANGTAADFECRISRSATYHNTGTPVFINETIALMYEAETTNWATVEVAPDWSTYPPLTYTFAATPPPLAGSAVLVSLASANWQVNDAGIDLGTDWRAPGYDDTQAGWSAGQGLFGFTTQPGSWPTIQKTLAAGANTYYFRTHFQWTYDPGSAVFVVTNYLSDGAVYYLNGLELRRVRMPAGTIGFTTNATSSNVGTPEVFGLFSPWVFAGDNVLEVETHQAAGSSADMVFGLSVTAASQFAPLIVTAGQPADRTVTSGQATTFSAEVLGQPLAFQWLKNGSVITNATNATYTINPVLSTDAGNYALRVSNSLGTNASRAAVLTVTVLPVGLDDLTKPADLTVAQGQPATFTVVASGSELQYQWRKGVTAITDATNATYTIAATVLADAGAYACTVSNPVSSTNSRAAILNVVVDVAPPTLAGVAGSPNKVLVTFSEAVDATTANHAANYSLSGGVSVLTATKDAINPHQVSLTTGPQTQGAAYVLTVNNVRDLFNNTIAANSRAAFISTILVDGSSEDWQGMAPLYSGASNSPAATNFKDIWVFNDAKYIYFRLTTWDPTTFLSYYNNLFFDGDNNPASGYVGWGGAEMLVQYGNGYQEKNGGFNEGAINGLDWLCVPAGSDTNFEFRVSRAATYASDSGKVFTTNVINFVFDGETTGYSAVNRAPVSGTIAYTLVEPAPLPLGPLSIAAAGGSVTVSWPGAGTLQSSGVLNAGGWTNVTTSGNSYLAPVGPGQRYFRLVQ